MARGPRKRSEQRTGGKGPPPGASPPSNVRPRRPGASRRESDRRLVRAYRALAQCNRALVRATSEPDLLVQLCRVLVQVGEYAMAWVGYAQDDAERTVRCVAQAGVSDGYLDQVRIRWGDDAHGRGPTGTCIRTGAPSVNRNSLTEPTFEPWRAAALERGYRSSISLPLDVDRRVIGALTVYSSRPDAFDPDEEELLLRLSEDLAFGIAALRSREARRRAEAAHSDSDALLRAVADSSPDPIFAKDREGRFTFANPATCQLFGKAAADLLGRTSAEITGDPERTDLLMAHDREVLASGTAQAWVETVPGADGPRRFLTTKAPLRDASGRVAGIVGVAKDFTDRERAEEELRRSEERFRTLAEEAPVGIFETDPEGRSLYVNRAAEALLGATAAAPAGRVWTDLVHPDEADRVHQEWRAARDAGIPFAGEHRLVLPAGREAWVRVHAGPLRDGAGTVRAFIGVIEDVTGSRRAAAAQAGGARPATPAGAGPPLPAR